ncbi:glycosyltransferase [Desulfofustis glycolicus]|uniref:Glycosyltransferase involved in cell wall bisynthesis n=1 Tax=Desulfofustis glycolicus DSM 9705 TaxID=1121409 RepID=A0A1M5YKN9_9BACT|nr:glycosyltransferase family 1 protein [Desulfofustis glycolicus]MCB2214756.1 glycosyltransferase family 1 protein [Desulfobulbaceae bacterium]SHI12617.1 Glycosyltransferase involved in cell wall bisynthesis [Desulfofustis glycolicus DSM 9705]
MNIVMITNNDPAGMGIAFTNAINRYSEHTCRLITTTEMYGFEYESDIHFPDIKDDDFDEVEFLIKNADIIHFHLLRDENSHLGPLLIRDYIRGKKIIHHHHGHPDYIININEYNEKYRKLGRKVIVSTPDLLQIADNATWIPNIVPINDVHYLPRYDPTLLQTSIRICQAPTRKYHKHTDIFTQIIQELATEHLNLKMVIIERIPHVQCLKLKRNCHIVFDHMRGWFGISSLESLSQGKPVIAGLDDWNIRCIKEFTGTNELPWQVAHDAEELRNVFRKLINDSELRYSIGRFSRAFMEKHWTERHVVQILEDFYRNI